MRQRTEITWETEETVVVRRGVTILPAICPNCESNVDMMSPEVLASLAGSDEREIFRLIEAGQIHFVESDRILACSSCCRRLFDQANPNSQPKTLLIKENHQVSKEKEK